MGSQPHYLHYYHRSPAMNAFHYIMIMSQNSNIDRIPDSRGKYALHMSLQTREQFIPRDKATLNVSVTYAMYHEPTGITTESKSNIVYLNTPTELIAATQIYYTI